MIETDPRIVVTFRNDDPSALSDLKHEREIFGLFERYRVPMTIGVIPEVCTGSLWDPARTGERSLASNREMVDFLAQFAARTGSELALHGLTHRTNSRSVPARKHYSEFSGLSFAEQERMLRRGAGLIREAFGAFPTTFIPPWNEMDHNTVRACAAVGLKVISASYHVPTVAGTFSFSANTNLHDFAEAVTAARRGKGLVFVNVLFHSNTLSRDAQCILARALEMASGDAECEALTIAAVVERFPEEVRRLNAVGRNMVEFCELPGSKRARCWVYLKGMGAICRRSRITKLQQQIRLHYLRGDYDSCAALTRPLDRECAVTLWGARTAAFFAGALGAFLLSTLVRWIYPHFTLAWLWLLPVPFGICGVTLGRVAVSRDSREELLTAGLLTASGTAAGLQFVDLLH
jgi:peptidoglycan/xylan/chitin deacetylase (PgdA/CDA1 family)